MKNNRLRFGRNFLRLFMSLLAIGVIGVAHARYPGELRKSADPSVVASRSDCNQGKSRYDMQLNNVRATLLSSGDVWWDLKNAGYVVPKVQPGTGAKAVSSIFAGAVWLGGKDPSGNLKVACQTYRSATETDFWPGPLNENGQTSKAVCDQWDKHFAVFRTDIDSCIRLFRAAKEKNPNNPVVDPSLIPESVKGWPANGNPYFFEVHRFTLPRTKAGLGKFHDEDQDLNYDPTKGDYPTIDIKGCNIDVFPDEMVFWIYNDNGNVHTNSLRSLPIQMEVQVQAFSYQTNDELNDMTFQRYKLINRAKTDIDSMYFAMWVDPDLGCYTDDYVGCDTTRSLMYVYNQDIQDGTTGCDCAGTNTYCDKIPLLGVDYFRGPNDENGKELGMSSFTYYLNASQCNPLAGTTDPNTANEYYNYLTGFWRDGTPYTFGGSGYNPNSTSKRLKFAFVDAPKLPRPYWSMSSEGLGCGDRRTIQASGPLKLKPGAVNELIIGVPWVPDIQHPAPDIRKLQEADDIAQALFDACFKIFDGPDAPSMSFIELDREIIAVLTNAPTPQSNNAAEGYKEAGLRIPRVGNKDTNYLFQGYKVYQLHDGDVGVSDLENASKARLVAQVDIQDGISKIFNWTQQEDPNFLGRTINTPVLKVDGANTGIKHTFSIKEDKFATGDDKKLINHKKYYFLTIAYAYNNYLKFDGLGNLGQRDPYVVGRRNIGDRTRGNKAYEVLPRPIVDVKLGSNYGEGAIVTRLDGIGNGGNFIELSDATIQEILTKGSATEGLLTYKPGLAPIDVKIVNPLEVVDGTYTLQIKDKDMTDDIVEDTARWELRREGETAVVFSERNISKLNEQIIAKYGFSVSIRQVGDTGLASTSDKTNGAVGATFKYKNVGQPWLAGIPDDLPFVQGLSLFNYIKTGTLEADFLLDPNNALAKIANYNFVPYALCDYRDFPTDQPYITPAWQRPNNINGRIGGITRLNNVDIVFTSDKSKWSRCVVVETAGPYYYDAVTYKTGVGLTTVGNVKNFDLRGSPSVGKDADPSDPNKPVGQVLPDETMTKGMGWFPGYAIDVETGQRLNIFFGENSVFDPGIGQYTDNKGGFNRDMVFNPSDQAFLNVPSAPIAASTFAYNAFMGGQHMVYVTNTPYDNCASIRDGLNGGSEFRKIAPLQKITWAGMLMAFPGQKMLSYKDGLIPNDLTVKLRVNNPYSPMKGKGTNSTHPAYQFKLESKTPTALANAPQVDSSLNMINIVPNPYYGYSAYEINELSTTVKITNLPPKSTVTVYTLDGRFIRQFKRDERASENNLSQNPGARYKQFAPDLEWDMKNDKGIPVASGVYLINISAEGLGQRTLKFFAINRQFDPSRL
jgi:hypothetical protein